MKLLTRPSRTEDVYLVVVEVREGQYVNDGWTGERQHESLRSGVQGVISVTHLVRIHAPAAR